MHRNDVDRMLQEAGYQWVRSRGGHHTYRNPASGQIVTIAAHGKRTYSAPEVALIQRELRQRAAAARPV